MLTLGSVELEKVERETSQEIQIQIPVLEYNCLISQLTTQAL